MAVPILFIIQGACSLGAQITLEYLEIPYQVSITTPEIRVNNEFLRINPSGKVGALKDGNEVVAENLAILLYLADKFSFKNICPALGSHQRTKVYQWLSVLSSSLHPSFSQVFYAQRFVDSNSVDKFRELALVRLYKVLEQIENGFNQYNWFITDRPCIVEAQAYALLRWTRQHNVQGSLIDLNSYPKIQKFLDAMEQLQYVKNALAIEQKQPERLINSKFAGYFEFENI